MEYDETTQEIIKLFITDSDDARGGSGDTYYNDPTNHQLVTLGCERYSSGFIGLKSFQKDADGNYLVDENGNYIVDDHGSYAGTYLLSVDGLSTMVPEPASSFLSLAGTAFMLIRRRKAS